MKRRQIARERPTRRFKSRLGTIGPFIPVLLTLLLRVLFILEMLKHPFSSISPQIVDSWAYHRQALNIINGNFWGSEVFFLRPIYPYLLALFYALFGRKVLSVQIFQALLGTASCFLLTKITERVFNRSAAFIGNLGFALCGVLVFYTGALSYVEITIFFSLLFLYLIYSANERWWLWAIAGVSFGLLALCRPEMILLLPFFIIWLIRRKAKPKHLALLTSAAVIVIASVPIRNYLVARDPVLFTAHSGINFYFGNNPGADGTWQPAGKLSPGFGFSHEQLKRVAKYVNGKALPWSKASGYWIKQGLRFIVSQPVSYLKLLCRKLLLFFSNYEIPNNYYFETVRPFSLLLKITFINFGTVAALGILGMVYAWRLRSQSFPLYLFIAGYLFSALLFYVLSRLRAPVMPFFLSFAGFGLWKTIGYFKKGVFGRPVLSLIFVLLFYLGTNIFPIDRKNYLAQGWTQLGNIYLEKKKVQPGLSALSKALAFNPQNISARYSLIQAYAGMGRVAEAENEFQELAQFLDTTSTARMVQHLAIARIAIARRDFTTAAENYQRALAINSNEPETWFLLGLVYISLNDLPSAEKCLLQTLALDPFHDAAHNVINEVRRHLKK